jgi:hypothetical protein
VSEILKFIEFNQYNLPALLELLGLYFVFLYLATVVWVYKDITTRSNSILVAIASTLFVLVGNLPALVIYLLIRPERTLDDNKTNDLFYASVLDKSITSCPDCHNLVRQDYKFCPNCSAEVQQHCANCGELVNPLWRHCASCNYRLSKPGKLNSFFGGVKETFKNTSFTRPQAPKLNLRLPKLSLPKLRLPKVSLPKIRIQFPKLKFPVRKLSAKKPAVKVIAEKRHQPKVSKKTAVVVAAVPSAENKSKSGAKRRGRPKGIKDNKPRKQRSDAGKKRGSYGK